MSKDCSHLDKEIADLKSRLDQIINIKNTNLIPISKQIEETKKNSTIDMEQYKDLDKLRESTNKMTETIKNLKSQIDRLEIPTQLTNAKDMLPRL